MYTSAILCNLSNSFGLRDDIAVLERVIQGVSLSLGITVAKPLLRDIRQPHTPHTDIQFHLEIPCFSAIPWAHTNVMLVNPDHWSYAFDAYVHAFDALLFRDPAAMVRFANELAAKGLRANHLYYIPWCDAWQTKEVSPFYSMNQCLDEFICFVGGSTAKYEYVKALLAFWKEGDPALTVYTTRQDYADGLRAAITVPTVKVIREELTKEQQYKVASQYHGHLIGSQGEAFGYAAAHAEVSGAFALMNRLSVFETMYAGEKGIAWLSNQYQESTAVRYAWATPDATVVRAELEVAFAAFAVSSYPAHFARQITASKRFEKTQAACATLFQDLLAVVQTRRPAKGIFHCPPILRVEDCPPISVITPTYNRKKLIDIAFHNMLATDYPLANIEWIIIEDNEKTPHLAADKVIEFQVQNPSLRLKYIPIEGRMSIGEKRNHAIEHATHEIILFMDDDDHYPSTSFRRRVAWLLQGTQAGKQGVAIACCTTLPLYDLNRGISAVNVPPFDIPFCQRISEATLTFKKSAWEERRFPNVSMAEGESWIEGRETQVIEMPPQQIIVAFTHGSNQSSRRVYPKETTETPSCFWGFPKEYLTFIHGLVGVEVEEIREKKVSTKK